MRFFVYILECSDGSYYVGHTTDVEERVARHNEGRAAAWTACRRPVRLVYREEHPDESAAVRRELQIKGWTKAKKKALIVGNAGRLKVLSRCRRQHPLPVQ